MIPLDRPIRIDSREVVLVDDLVLTPPAGALAERLVEIDSEDPGLPLYVEQQQVDTLSELHPGLPLYGLWQTLIASGLVPQPGLYQVDTDSSPHPGRYLLRETNGAYSGRIVDEILLDAFAPDKTTCTPVALDPSLDSLRLPARPIQTLRHRQDQKVRARLQALVLAGIMALVSAFAGTAADRLLNHRHAQKQQQAEHLRRQTAQLQQELMQLGAGGRIEPIDQSLRLNQLLILSRHFQPVELPQTSVLSVSGLTATIHPTTLPPVVPRGLPVRQNVPQPNGSLHISW